MARIDISGDSAAAKAMKPWSERMSDLLNRDFSLAPGGMSDTFKERLYSDLHVLISSGLDLRSALDILTGESSDTAGREVLGKVREGVFAGRNLADVLQGTEGFGAFEVSTVRIGEETGSLARVMGNLSEDFKERIRLRRELVTAFSYPVMVTLIAFLAVAFMLAFVVPLFSDLFERMGQDLPWLTRQVVGLSSAFSDWWWAAVLFVAGVGGVYILSMRRPDFRARLQHLSMRLPWFGRVLRESKLARFCGSMSFLLDSNVNLLRSLRLSADMTDFAPITEAVQGIDEGLVLGESLRDLMRQHVVFDQRFIALITVGEEVNRLSEVLRHLSDQYSDRVQRSTRLLSTFIEPVMIGFLGVLVGVILVSMYLPLFEMNAGFN